MNEDKLNLMVAETLQHYLEQSGSFVVVTRNTDEALGDNKRSDMKNRKSITNESQGDILISIHQNSFPKSNVKGAQVFYHNSSEKGKILANTILEEMISFADGENKREAKANTDYYILKNTSIPAIIVECGFLTNPDDEKKLNTQEYREKIAWSIYMGILKYFEKLDMQ